MPDNTKDAQRPGSWWTTLPGLLTALAAVATAVTGLLVGLSQAGLIGSPAAPDEPARAAPGTALPSPLPGADRAGG